MGIQSLPAKVRAYEEQRAREPNDSGKIYNSATNGTPFDQPLTEGVHRPLIQSSAEIGKEVSRVADQYPK